MPKILTFKEMQIVNDHREQHGNEHARVMKEEMKNGRSPQDAHQQALRLTKG